MSASEPSLTCLRVHGPRRGDSWARTVPQWRAATLTGMCVHLQEPSQLASLDRPLFGHVHTVPHRWIARLGKERRLIGHIPGAPEKISSWCIDAGIRLRYYSNGSIRRGRLGLSSWRESDRVIRSEFSSWAARTRSGRFHDAMCFSIPARLRTFLRTGSDALQGPFAR